MALLDRVVKDLMYGLNPLMSRKQKRVALGSAIQALGKRAAARQTSSGAVASAAQRGRSFVEGQQIAGETRKDVAKR